MVRHTGESRYPGEGVCHTPLQPHLAVALHRTGFRLT